MHPDTLWHLWQELMDKLCMQYGMHDLRRTFITNAPAAHKPLDVMLAAGHSNISTTMKYLVDHRQLEHDVWLPTASL